MNAETVVIFKPPVGTRYLYIDKATGAVTLETTFQETTPDKCLLLRVIRVDNTASTVLDFVNKVFIHRAYRITDAAGSIQNDFPVKPSFISFYHCQED
jgi:hypothetical protein